MKLEVFTTVNFGLIFVLVIKLQSSAREPTCPTCLPHYGALLPRWQ